MADADEITDGTQIFLTASVNANSILKTLGLQHLVGLTSRGGSHIPRNVAMYLFTVMALVSLAAGTAAAQDCTLVLPANPLSAAGLSTPFVLTGPGCTEDSLTTGAFAQAAIYDPASHTISAYNPLIVDTSHPTPAIAPTPPTLPAGTVVALWFGYNGNNLFISGPAATTNCVSGTTGAGTTVFSRFSYCNAVAFFAAVNADAALLANIPPLGTSPPFPAGDGKPCPSVRDFRVVDQDMSDNLPTEYLRVTATGNYAQNTAANRVALGAGTFTKIVNPGDERLVSVEMDPKIGCLPWKVQDLADAPGALVATLATNELLSAAHPPSPVAYIPSNNPMAQDSGVNNLAKIDLYRAGVNQPPQATSDHADPTAYCMNIRAIQPAALLQDKTFFAIPGSSPNPATSDSLFTFMALRYVVAYQILGCANLLNQPVNLFLTITNGIVTDATTDNTPPVIVPHITGTLGNNGWYLSNVTVSWSVTDLESGIASSTGCGTTNLTANTAGTILTCMAINGAGLPNSVSVTIKIDKTSPLISGMPDPGCTLWPPNHKLVQVATVTAADALSGLSPGSFKVTGTSNEPDPSQASIVITPDGSGGFVVQLQADRLDNGNGRVYTVTATANDLAGNTATTTATCMVPHDQGQ
jgi:hypothetical protein